VNFTTEFSIHSTIPSRRLFLTPVITAASSVTVHTTLLAGKIRVLLSSKLSVLQKMSSPTAVPLTGNNSSVKAKFSYNRE
jgi:hypothetical protein